MIRRFFASSFVLLCATIFEAAVLSNITFLPAIPDFSLLCVIFFAVNNGKIMGESTGFVSGIMLDFLSSCPFGFNSIYRIVIGYLAGFFKKTLNTDAIFVPFILAFFGTILKSALIFILTLLFPAISIKLKFFSLNFVFELGLNCLLAPFVFRFLKIFRNSLIAE